MPMVHHFFSRGLELTQYIGTRLRLAWVQALCFGGLVSVNAALVILRHLRGQMIIDEGRSMICRVSLWGYVLTCVRF